MGPSARVGSIEKLQALHDALARFAVEAQGALDAGRTAIRRALDGLHDALRRWQVEVQRRQEDVNRARADLSHSRAIRQGEAGRAGTVEQEIALQKARQRLQEAEEKVERTRRWLRLLPDALAEVETPSRHLAGLLESDLRQALALLDGKIAALTAYAELAAREAGKGGAVSLNAAAVELSNALKTVRLLWEEARSEWDDAVARDFEARWWAPLDAQVRAAVGAMDRVAPVLNRAREECS